jgi:hypothetical protein
MREAQRIFFSLFNDALSNSDCTLSDDWVMVKYEWEKVLKKRLWSNLRHCVGVCQGELR